MSATTTRIFVVDPSLFTLPYDSALCAALSTNGCDVTLYGRKLRQLEAPTDDVRVDPLFYRYSERAKGALPGQVFRAVKAAEHWADLRRLIEACRRQRPFAVHFQWVPAPALDRTAVRRIKELAIPVVLTVHDIAPFNNSPGSTLQRIGATTIWGMFDHLIVHSESSRQVLLDRGYPSSRVSIVPHGVLRGGGGSASARNTGTVTFLLFGRIKTYKGVDVMIEALGMVPKQVRRLCRVLVVGDPLIPMAPMQKRAAELGVSESIVWDLKYVSDSDMAAAFGQTDVFAFPYREIDTSGVLMSCLPYGKPVIASEIGAFAKLIQDGVHGRLVPVGDPAALAGAIIDLVSDPALRARYGANVATLTDAIPPWSEIAQRTIAIYEGLRA